MGVDTKKSLEIIHLRGTVAVNLRPYTKIEVKIICNFDCKFLLTRQHSYVIRMK